VCERTDWLFEEEEKNRRSYVHSYIYPIMDQNKGFGRKAFCKLLNRKRMDDERFRYFELWGLMKQMRQRGREARRRDRMTGKGTECVKAGRNEETGG
jgi:hypothetical protein